MDAAGVAESKLSIAWESVTTARLLTAAIIVGRADAYICNGAISAVRTFKVF